MTLAAGRRLHPARRASRRIRSPVRNATLVPPSLGKNLSVPLDAKRNRDPRHRRRRRRRAYPNALIMALGSVQTVEGAAGRALQTLQGLLGLESSFLALGSAADLNPIAVSGVSRTAAKAILKAAGVSVAESMRTGEPLPLGPAPPSPAGLGPGRWVCLPIVSLHSPIGVLGLPAHHPSHQLKDRELLRGIGRALGLSLENLRQREDLRKSEAHLRVMVEQMPAVLWTTDAELRFTSSSGAGLAGLGLRP